MLGGGRNRKIARGPDSGGPSHQTSHTNLTAAVLFALCWLVVAAFAFIGLGNWLFYGRISHLLCSRSLVPPGLKGVRVSRGRSIE
jgi:hypothetical protein